MPPRSRAKTRPYATRSDYALSSRPRGSRCAATSAAGRHAGERSGGIVVRSADTLELTTGGHTQTVRVKRGTLEVAPGHHPTLPLTMSGQRAPTLRCIPWSAGATSTTRGASSGPHPALSGECRIAHNERKTECAKGRVGTDQRRAQDALRAAREASTIRPFDFLTARPPL